MQLLSLWVKRLGGLFPLSLLKGIKMPRAYLKKKGMIVKKKPKKAKKKKK
jgi:hypothetical protein|tara:strand:+ start:11436 stop:11585 length:150 start_codon:yes stop_codon:yes gene_type:complete